jgi:hypothetical protein
MNYSIDVNRLPTPRNTTLADDSSLPHHVRAWCKKQGLDHAWVRVTNEKILPLFGRVVAWNRYCRCHGGCNQDSTYHKRWHKVGVQVEFYAPNELEHLGRTRLSRLEVALMTRQEVEEAVALQALARLGGR